MSIKDTVKENLAYSKELLEAGIDGANTARREVLEAIDLDSIKSNGYSFQIEMTYRACCKGFRIFETPIVFEDRTAGKSKMSRKIFLEAVLMVWKLRLDSNIAR